LIPVIPIKVFIPIFNLNSGGLGYMISYFLSRSRQMQPAGAVRAAEQRHLRGDDPVASPENTCTPWKSSNFCDIRRRNLAAATGIAAQAAIGVISFRYG
jgi:hypothetical protein